MVKPDPVNYSVAWHVTERVFTEVGLEWRNPLYKYCGSRLILKMRSEVTFLEK